MFHCEPVKSAEGAIAYFGKAYDEHERVLSWTGKGAATLGLHGQVDMADWRKLVRGKDPEGNKLLQRDRKDRRPVYDFTVSVNKPTAILRALHDERIRGVIVEANTKLLEMIEPLMSTRITGGKGQVDVHTGNMIAASFYHDITRAREPGDHIHNTLMSLTEHEGRWWSPEMDSVLQHSDFLKAYFHNEVANGLSRLGYQIEPTAESYRIVGVPDSACEKLSTRRQDINAGQAKRAASTQEEIERTKDPVELNRLHNRLNRIKSPKGRAAIALVTRQKKQLLDPVVLKDEWRAKLTPEELHAIDRTYRKAAGGPVQAAPASRGKIDKLGMALEAFRRAFEADQAPKAGDEAKHLSKALQTLLKDETRVTEERLFATAMKQAVGHVTLEGLGKALDGLERLEPMTEKAKQGLEPDASRVVRAAGQASTLGALKQEAEFTDAAKQGRVVWVKRQLEDLPNAATLGAQEVYAKLKQAEAMNKTLILAGDAKGLPIGHPLKLLRDEVGMKPIGETSVKKTSVLKKPKLPRRVRAKVRRAVNMMRHVWRQPEERSHEFNPRTLDRDVRGFER